MLDGRWRTSIEKGLKPGRAQAPAHRHLRRPPHRARASSWRRRGRGGHRQRAPARWVCCSSCSPVCPTPSTARWPRPPARPVPRAPSSTRWPTGSPTRCCSAAWPGTSPPPRPGLMPLLPMAVLGASLIISYERAKAESLGFNAKGGVMERAERIIAPRPRAAVRGAARPGALDHAGAHRGHRGAAVREGVAPGLAGAAGGAHHPTGLTAPGRPVGLHGVASEPAVPSSALGARWAFDLVTAAYRERGCVLPLRPAAGGGPHRQGAQSGCRGGCLGRASHAGGPSPAPGPPGAGGTRPRPGGRRHLRQLRPLLDRLVPPAGTLSSAEVDRRLRRRGLPTTSPSGLAGGKGAILALPHLGRMGVGRVLAHPGEEGPGHRGGGGRRATGPVRVLQPSSAASSACTSCRSGRRRAGRCCGRSRPGTSCASSPTATSAATASSSSSSGRPPPFPAGPATLALRTGARLLPVGRLLRRAPTATAPWCSRRCRPNATGDCEPTWPRVTDRHRPCRLEELIRAAPEQWHLQQPNWPSDYDALEAIGKPHPGPPSARRPGRSGRRPDGDLTVRIGLVCPYSLTLPGGVQGQVLALARSLRDLGHEVRVLGPCDGPPPDCGGHPARRQHPHRRRTARWPRSPPTPRPSCAPSGPSATSASTW